MDVLLILIVASMLCFVGMIISEKKKQLGFFSVVLSTCATCGAVNAMDDLGSDFLLILIPLVFILLISIVVVIRVGVE